MRQQGPPGPPPLCRHGGQPRREPDEALGGRPEGVPDREQRRDDHQGSGNGDKYLKATADAAEGAPPVGGGHGLPHSGRSTTRKSVTFASTAGTSDTSTGKQRHDDSSNASSGAGDTTFLCVFLERGNEQVTEPQRSKQKHVRAELGLAGVERELVVGVEGEGERVERGSLSEVEREALGEVGAWWLAGDSEVLSELDWKNARNEHVLRSHVPYNSSCEECCRARARYSQLESGTQQRHREGKCRQTRCLCVEHGMLCLCLCRAFAWA